MLAVIAYHLNFGWASGGLLGVQVFFVLSGYLITDLLVAEYGRHRGIGLKNVLDPTGPPAPAGPLRDAVRDRGLGHPVRPGPTGRPAQRPPGGDLLLSNWWYIFHHVSYFARFGPPSPLGHLWSLAIEEQFYLVWPLLILAGIRWLAYQADDDPGHPGRGLGSALEMGLLYRPQRQSHPGLRRHRHPGLRAC